MHEARLVRAAGQVPSDEVGALRARLMTRLGRQPGDIGILLRSGEAVSRMLGAKHRRLPDEARKLGENYIAVINSLSDETAEPHWGDAWKPEAGAE